jgi:hypothetical protein
MYHYFTILILTMRFPAFVLLLTVVPISTFSVHRGVAVTSRESKTSISALNEDSNLGSSRRDLLIQGGGIALSSFLLGYPLGVSAIESQTKTIVVTGSNSGIGFEACKRLASQGHNLVLACRTIEKARDAADRLKEYGGNLIPAECDLASLRSIDKFSAALPNLVGNGKIDALCLNAGLSRNTADKDCARTEDGFELTGRYSASDYAV